LSKIFNSMSKSLLKGKSIQDPVQIENHYQEKILDLELKLKIVMDELSEKMKSKEIIPIVEVNTIVETVKDTSPVPMAPDPQTTSSIPSCPPSGSPPGPGGPPGPSKNGNNFGIKLPDSNQSNHRTNKSDSFSKS
jgi:hypothetical protein